MHHIHHLRKQGEKATGFLSLMSTLNRKQIPVCKPCHKKIHNGLYNDISIRNITKPNTKTFIIKPKSPD